MALESTPICFRVSQEERQLLEAAAARIGKPMSAFMRYYGMKGANEVAARVGGVDSLQGWYADVQRQGAEFELGL